MKTTSAMSNFRWRAVASLVIIYLAVLFNLWWLWGVLMIAWGVADLVSGSTWLSEFVQRRSNPILYFLIVGTWLVFGFYLALSPFFN